MAVRMSFQIAIGALLAVLAAQSAAGELVIEKAERQVTAISQRVKYSVDLTVKNTGGAAVDSITLCEQAALREHAAMYEVGLSAGKDFSPLAGAPAPAPARGVACEAYPLALAPGASARLALKAVFTGVLRPHPAEVTQTQPQRVLLEGLGLYLASPYRVLHQETKLDLGAGRVEAYPKEPKPMDKRGGRLTYGPYKDVEPLTLAPLTVHYENNFPFVVASEVVREIEISHWGNVYIEESYDLRNAGARIKGEWSRLDYMTKDEAGRGVVRELRARLLPGAHSLYFRDAIGNISSSAVQEGREGVSVALQPRFPLFGGWTAKLLFGWSMPLPAVVLRSAGGSYALTELLGPAVEDLVTEQLTVKVVLPEGASYLGVQCQLNPEVSFEKKFTYFDVSGRTVVVLRKRNFVPEMNVPFTVTYDYPLSAMLQKPLLVVAAFAAIFAVIMVYSRTEFSINGKLAAAGKTKTS